MQQVVEALKRDDINYIKESIERGNIKVNDHLNGKELIHYAVINKKKDIIEYLLCKGADINSLGQANSIVYQSPLFFACENNDKDIIEYLLSKGANVDQEDNIGYTALVYALNNDKYEIADFLLEHKADINHHIIKKGTPLLLAIIKNNLELVKYIVNHSADLTTKCEGATPLDAAILANASDEIIIFLLENGVDMNNSSSLKTAIANGKNHAAKLLIDKGMSLKISDGETPLNTAVFMNNIELVNLLIEKGADINEPNSNGCMPLHIAARHNCVEIAKLLINKGAKKDVVSKIGSPYAIALGSGNKNIVSMLVDPNKKNNQQLNMELYLSCKTGNIGTIRQKIREGADVNFIFMDGTTPLIIAAVYEKFRVMEELLKNKADINLNTFNGTALHLAAVLNKPRSIEFLINHGANPEIHSGMDYATPLTCGVLQNSFDAVRALIKKGANINSRHSQGATSLILATSIKNFQMVQFLVENNANLDLQDNDGNTALLNSIRDESFEIVNYLIDKGANISIGDVNGFQPIHLSCSTKRVRILNKLIEKGADVNARTLVGITPLHMASQMKSLICVKILLQNGADPNLEDKAGSPPLTYAYQANASDVLHYLIEHGANISQMFRIKIK